MLLSVHLLLAGLWLGCVLTEALFERALLGQGRAQELLLAQLHWRVDLWVEIPAFMGVLITGGLLLGRASPPAWLHLKVALALLAVLANVVCVGLVWTRARAAWEGDWSRFERLDHWQHLLGAVVLLGLLGAMLVGLFAL